MKTLYYSNLKLGLKHLGKIGFRCQHIYQYAETENEEKYMLMGYFKQEKPRCVRILHVIVRKRR
jgi:hypothetical protein